MEFDKSRVYTAVNADELQIGSRCIFADTLAELKELVQNSVGWEKTKLKRIQEDTEKYRFIEKTGEMRMFAYLIEPPAEPKYKPFSDIEKTFEIIKKHGGWIKSKTNADLQLVSCIGKITDSVLSISCWTSETLLENFVFADDGSPCGELVES